MDINKVDITNPCSFEPFGFIEKKVLVKCKEMNDILLIAYGALNHMGRYAPEFGGIAIVDAKDDTMYALHCYPFNPKLRLKKLQEEVNYLQSVSTTITEKELKKEYSKKQWFLYPKYDKYIREFILEIAEHKPQRAEEIRIFKEKTNKISTESMKHERTAVLKTYTKIFTPDEKRKKNMSFYYKAELDPDLKGEKKITNGKNKKVKMFKGEELIPIDDEEE